MFDILFCLGSFAGSFPTVTTLLHHAPRISCRVARHEIRGIDAEGAGKSGLVTRHLYFLLRTVVVTLADESKERLVQLRNPWGRHDWKWTGDWSDSSSKWDQNPDVVVRAIGCAGDADGTFWMSWQDWTDNFTRITVCPKDMASGELQGEDYDDDDYDECVQGEVHG